MLPSTGGRQLRQIMKKIIILGSEDDREVKLLSEHLLYENAQVYCLDLCKTPEQYQFHWKPESAAGSLLIDDQLIPFTSINGLFWRNANPSNQPLSRNLYSALSPFLYQPNLRWINSINAINYHQNKPRQLYHAKQLGADIPDTYVGNSLSEAQRFISTHPQVIIKPVQGGAYTRELVADERTSDGLATLLSKDLVTLQRRINGMHIRTFVINDHVLSAAIGSDQLDYRLDEHAFTNEFTLPQYETELSRRICTAFGMAWCAIDWKYDEGRFVFLEANPAPHFAEFETKTRYPITACIANLLLR